MRRGSCVFLGRYLGPGQQAAWNRPGGERNRVGVCLSPRGEMPVSHMAPEGCRDQQGALREEDGKQNMHTQRGRGNGVAASSRKRVPREWEGGEVPDLSPRSPGQVLGQLSKDRPGKRGLRSLQDMRREETVFPPRPAPSPAPQDTLAGRVPGEGDGTSGVP